MHAMRLYTPGPAESRPLRFETDMALPQIGPGELLIAVSVCGVCHTDLHIVEGELVSPLKPITPGHQVVGRVAQAGGGVDSAAFPAGKRVGVPWLYSTDQTCPQCRAGRENLCPQARFTGLHAQGGFAGYMVAPADYVLALPDALSDEQAAPLLCAGIIGYRSMRQAELQPGEHLGLFGFGASAHLVIQAARAWGCRVSVFTRSELHQRHARELGADFAGNAADKPPQPLDRAILFAPVGALVPVALEKLRPGGTLAMNAVYLSPLPEMDYHLIYGERTLRSVANATRQDGREFIELAARIPLHADTVEYDLRDANQALLDLKRSAFAGEAILRVV